MQFQPSADPVIAPVEAIVKCTLGHPGKCISFATGNREISVDGKIIKPGAKVTVHEGSVIAGRGERISVVSGHLANLRAFLKGDPPLGVKDWSG